MCVRTSIGSTLSEVRLPVIVDAQQTKPAAEPPAAATGAAPSEATRAVAGARREWWRVPTWWLVAFVVACAWDRALWLAATRSGVARLQWLEDSIGERQLQAMLRAIMRGSFKVAEITETLAYGAAYLFGRIWPWIALALFFIFRHWAGTDGHKVKEGLRRGVFVVLVPGSAGLMAEMLKLVVRRMRPEALDGWYAFKAWPQTGVLSGSFWNGSGIGLASSHAAVAFGGALAAGLLLPRWRIPLFLLAGLCAASRIAVGAHFLSDVVAGVACAYASYKLFYAWDARNNGGKPLAA
jgi:membrane-associated phospholipid phosphatase